MDINEIAGGGGKAWSPETIGDKVEGTILLIEKRQQRDFSTGEPLEWADGSPRMLTYVELQTDEKDSDDDDGVRSIYCKGGKSYEAAEGSGHSAEVALVEAAKKAGFKSIDEGMKLTMAHTGLAKPTTRGYQPARLYKAKLEAGTSSVDIDDLDF